MVTPGWESFFVDVRNGLLTRFHEGLDAIANVFTSLPTVTEILTSPEAIAAAFLIVGAAYVSFDGVKTIGKAALALDLTAQHLAESAKNVLHPSKTR